MSRRAILVITALALATVVASACSSAAKGVTVKLAPVSALPMEMQNAPATVRTAYQFAVANPEALENVPCYCGCGAVGHHSNRACFIQDGSTEGNTKFDSHAMGCSICVDIAQDVMKMTGQGKSPEAIRSQIVSTYSQFGPANQ